MIRVARICFLALCGLIAAAVSTAQTDSTSPFGMPKQFKEVAVPSYAVWHADGFWNIRVRSGSKKAAKKDKTTSFTGYVKVVGGSIVKGNLPGLEAAKGKSEDWIFPHKDGIGRTTGFDFRWGTGGKIDGINFSVSKEATGVTFRLLVEGSQYPKRILIGAEGVHPKEATFTLPAHP